MAYVTATFASSRARMVAGTRRQVSADHFPLLALALSIALLVAYFAYQGNTNEVGDGNLTATQLSSD